MGKNRPRLRYCEICGLRKPCSSWYGSILCEDCIEDQGLQETD